MLRFHQTISLRSRDDHQKHWIPHRGFFKREPTFATWAKLSTGAPTSPGQVLPAENINSNGFTVFETSCLADTAMRKRSEIGKERGFHYRLAHAAIRIAETYNDWEKLSRFGSYVVAVGSDLKDCDLYGRAWVRGKRVSISHDTWAPLQLNGLHTFSDFELVTRNTLGVVSELSRQAQERSRLIGLRIRWRI